MANLLFRLNGVPEDEAEEVRQLLEERGFDVYETHAGRWKVGVSAIWLTDPTQLDDARAALDAYQTERVQRARREYEQLRASGRAPTVWQKVSSNPVQFIGYILATGIIAGLMVLPLTSFLF